MFQFFYQIVSHHPRQRILGPGAARGGRMEVTWGPPTDEEECSNWANMGAIKTWENHGKMTVHPQIPLFFLSHGLMGIGEMGKS